MSPPDPSLAAKSTPRRAGRRGSGAVGARDTILVLGTGQRAGQATARSLSRAGFRVVGAWGGGRLAGRTRYCERLVQIPSSHDLERFEGAVHALFEREGVRAIVPLADELVGALLARPAAAAGAAVVGPPWDAFSRLADKRGLAATAAAVGVSVPPSSLVHPGEEPVETPALPAYVKVGSGRRRCCSGVKPRLGLRS